MSTTMTTKAGCSSKAGGSCKPDKLSLEVIIGKFSSPLTEEHAWAIVYEALKCLENLLRTFLLSTGGKTSSSSSGSQKTDRLVRKDLHLVRDTKEIFITLDGRVHESTYLDPVIITADGKDNLIFF